MSKIATASTVHYSSQIAKEFNSKNAAILINRIEYWFTKKREGFYKFIAPCKHYLYKEGDSWTEELGMSRPTFNKAFSIIGTQYHSKSAFLNETDKFQGKLYASYYDRKSNQMFFVRNHNFVYDFLNKINKKTYTQRLQNNEKTLRPGRKKTLSPLYKNNNLQTNSISLEKKEKVSSKNNFLSEEDRSNASEMIKIWKEMIGETRLKFISSTVLVRLSSCLKTHFENNLENWKYYLHLISSSRFLMGEIENTKFTQVCLLYAIGTECIEKIRGGEYTVKDRKTNFDKEISDRAAKQVEIDKKIKCVEAKKEDFERKEEYLEQKAQEENFNKLPDERKPEIIEKFVVDFQKKYQNLSIGRYITSKWKDDPFSDPMFSIFLSEHFPEMNGSVELENSFQSQIEDLKNEFARLNDEITRLNDEIAYFLDRKEEAEMGQSTFMKFFGLAGKE